MIPKETIEGINPGTKILYRGQDHYWYSGVVQKVGRNNGEPGSKHVGFLDIQPSDARLDRESRRLWDSSGFVYPVPEDALKGQMPIEELKTLLEAATPDPVLRFYCNEVVSQLRQIQENYLPNAAAE